MKKPDLSDSYRIINLIFAAILLMIFTYAASFKPGNDYPVASQYQLITGKKTGSTGLSRAFSEMVRLNFDQAKTYNENSLEVFAFFFIQLILRIIFFFTYPHTKDKKLMTRFDAVGSAALFLISFRNLIFSLYS